MSSRTASRWLLVIALLAFLQDAAFAQRPPVFSVLGVVVRDDTGDPLSKARVELRGGSPQSSIVTTDVDGKFYFHNLPAGTYQVFAIRDGFAPSEAGQKWPGGPGVPLQIAAGRAVPQPMVRMVAASA